MDYVRNMYQRSETVIRVGNQRSNRIPCNRGVRQGDPLSTILFNMVVDEAITQLNPAIGFTTSSGEVVLCLAFADDVILVASSRKGLLEQVATLEACLQLGGPELNARKSATLEIMADGKAKKWVFPFLQVGGKDVRAMGVNDTYKYLGLLTNYVGMKSNLKEMLKNWLERLKTSPLKPQQRMFLLRVYLVPRLYHQLVLGEISGILLESIDMIIRKSVREWLRLPKDTPVGFYHARTGDGGMAIPD